LRLRPWAVWLASPSWRYAQQKSPQGAGLFAYWSSALLIVLVVVTIPAAEPE
jgi:hypothetical protein